MAMPASAAVSSINTVNTDASFGAHGLPQAVARLAVAVQLLARHIPAIALERVPPASAALLLMSCCISPFFTMGSPWLHPV
jgi:hypothetical protein